MTIIKNSLLILCIITSLFSCNNDDDNGGSVQELTREESEIQDRETIQTYLRRHYYNSTQLDSLQSIGANQTTLYASLELIGEHENPPEPYRNEINVSRDYFDLEGNPIELTTLASGDLVLVRITASAARDLPDALVVDLLPAGLEIENQNLADASVDISKLTIEGVSVADWQQRQQIEHVEYRDDRFVAALRLDEYRSRQLFYLVRAVTPGEYSVPAPYAEDMYRPFYHALGVSPEKLVITP